MISWFEARAWQAGTIGAAALSLALAGGLGVTLIQKHQITKSRDALYAQIHDEGTGYAARLLQSQITGATLLKAIDTQNSRIDEIRIESDRKIAASAAALGLAQVETLKANRRVADFLAAPVAGDTACDRVGDVDRRLLEMLK